MIGRNPGDRLAWNAWRGLERVLSRQIGLLVRFRGVRDTQDEVEPT